ncbi:L,D-transpeptidase family protein [Pseudodonghicola flavimaris]|uniref:L,D-transpeptidase family protein n=1 Tax=Pseudodonghicola flavimaris TaxID=3050036 RepID=A0ABT7F122_9RHOB|nr:L,D-transpeptidase family protein [Pseudodonghicola flavimaris]MDK3018301.1 L,D-transpeptidase family protein [Pseudodonghicola flavimaris]
MLSCLRLSLRSSLLAAFCSLCLGAGLSLGMVSPAAAQVTAFKQAVAESASVDEAVAAFYRDRNYAPIWTGADESSRARRAALLDALSGVSVHGLPPARYGVDQLKAKMAAVRTTRDLGEVEVALSRAFVTYAKDVQTGLLTPSKVDADIKREVPLHNREAYLNEFALSEAPQSYLRALPPVTAEYRGLMKEKLRLEYVMAHGGWGPQVPGKKIEPGDRGPAVIALRNRLVTMGYLDRSATGVYDAQLQQAVQRFQLAHGLEGDGVAGTSTLGEINAPVAERLESIIVAMERERWLNHERGDRHILVNQTDFSAKIIDHGRVTFETRSVIGKNAHDRRSPEFSDEMEHMVINPSWYVPRSIIVNEYLPKLRNNPGAVGHLEITDSRGRQVSRANTDFSQFSAKSFPYAMRQPPGARNALGRVKFMFPNKYNIYLHDTPQKNLFSREVRAYSHGCIRLADPFDFAYALLAPQEADPKAFFQSVLATGKETKVMLKTPVPVHLIYRTAFTNSQGRAEFRRDVYGRDAEIWDALRAAGVTLGAVQG